MILSPARRLLAGLLAATSATVAAWVLPASEAQADAAADITVTSLATDADGLSLTLTVTNTGDRPLYTAEVMLWRNSAGVADRAGLDALLASGVNTGGRLGYPNTDAYAVLSADGGEFAPGDSAVRTLEATWDELGLQGDGVYLVGAQLHAATREGAAGSVVATTRLLVVRPGAVTAQRATFVLLASAPSHLWGDEFADDHLADEFAPRRDGDPGGRLTELAHAAARSGTGWIIDPALYAAAQAMAAGYVVRTESGPVAGGASATARAWLNLVDNLPRGLGYRTPWGDPDLVLAGQLADQGVAQRAAEAWTAVLAEKDSPVAALADLPLAIRPAGGVADQAMLAAAQPLLEEGAVVLAETRADPPADVVVATLPEAFPLASGSSATGLQRRQQALADDYLAAVAGRPSVRVLATAAEAAQAVTSLPSWVDAVAAAGLPTVTAATTTAWAAARLTDTARDAAGRAKAACDVYRSLVGPVTGAGGTGAGTAAQVDAAVAAALSQNWASPDQAVAFAGAVEGEVRALLDRVHVGLKDIVLTARDTSFPISVANDLDRAVRVRLLLDSSSPLRLSVEHPAVIELQPGDTLTVVVKPVVRSNGQVTLTAQLTTEAGEPFGQPATASVTINQTGRLAWAIVVVSGLVLAIGTVLRVTSVQRSRRDGDTPSARVPRRRGRDGIGGPGPLDAGTTVSDAASLNRDHGQGDDATPLDRDHGQGDPVQSPRPPGIGTTASEAPPPDRDHMRGDTVQGPGPPGVGTSMSESAPLNRDHVQGDTVQSPGPPGAGTTVSDAAPLNRDHVRGDDAAPPDWDHVRGDDAMPPDRDHGRGDGDD